MSDGRDYSPFTPFRYPVFRALWIANIVSSFGWLVQGVGAAWLMTTLTDSADEVALVQTAITLPVMLFSLLSGAIADNFDRRWVMLCAQLGMLLVSLALMVCAYIGVITPWLLLSFSFLLGCGVAFNNPSWQASVGDIVPKNEVASAVLLNGAGFNVIRSVAPAIGGVIVAAAGAAAAFAVNVFSYLGLIGVLRWWRRREPMPARLQPPEQLWPAMTAGVRYVALSPRISRVLLRGFAFGFTCIIVLALLPIITRDLVHGDAVVFGALLGAYGIGAVAGAFGARRMAARMSRESMVRWMFAAFALCALIAAYSRSAWLTALAMIVGGAAWVVCLSQLNTAVQLSTPRWVVGRALALYQMSIFGGMAVGSWMWGVAAEQFGVETALLAAAVAMLLSGALGLLLPLLPNAEMNLDPLNRWQQPDVALDIEPRTGPVAVSITYRIDPADAEAFQALMLQRRSIRRRNGATQWTLLRDLADPQLWFERFEVPTWVDYVRFHGRTTHQDASIGGRIRAMHIGDEPPLVTRALIRDPARSRVHPVQRVADPVQAQPSQQQ